MKKPLISLDTHRKKFRTDKAAAADLGADYITYRRWLFKTAYTPDNSAWRMVMEAKGIELPRRPL